MADDRIRGDQDDLDLDESFSQEDGGVAELPEAGADIDEDDDFDADIEDED